MVISLILRQWSCEPYFKRESLWLMRPSQACRAPHRRLLIICYNTSAGALSIKIDVCLFLIHIRAQSLAHYRTLWRHCHAGGVLGKHENAE